MAKMPPKRYGPKPRELTREFMYECGALGLTQAEVGKLVGLSQARISERLSEDEELAEAWERGQGEICISLRRAQLESAIEKGNVVAQIWMGKQLLGQRDSIKEIEQKTDVQVTYIARWGGKGGELPPGDQEGLIEGEAEEEDDGD